MRRKPARDFPRLIPPPATTGRQGRCGKSPLGPSEPGRNTRSSSLPEFVADFELNRLEAPARAGGCCPRPYTTVVIAEEMMMKSPFFDLNHIIIRNYRHLGEDIGVSEMRRFSAELTNAIKQSWRQNPSFAGTVRSTSSSANSLRQRSRKR
jgi:hypothetical protein